MACSFLFISPLKTFSFHSSVCPSSHPPWLFLFHLSFPEPSTLALPKSWDCRSQKPKWKVLGPVQPSWRLQVAPGFESSVLQPQARVGRQWEAGWLHLAAGIWVWIRLDQKLFENSVSPGRIHTRSLGPMLLPGPGLPFFWGQRPK